MFSTLSERLVHRVRFVLTISWLILILSLFWDPFSQILTHPTATWSPFRINSHEYQCPILTESEYLEPQAIEQISVLEKAYGSECPKVQGHYFMHRPYALGNRIFWTMVVAVAPGFLLIFGHAGWRRICPLSFLSQLPRAMGWQQSNKISDKSWLGKNYWIFQFGLLYFGLALRLVLINSSRSALGWFLIFTIMAAMLTGLFFKGKTWCQFFCPFAPVQKILTGTGGLLERPQPGKQLVVSQSTCRTLNAQQVEVNACVGCKAACSDIDLERSYWADLNKPGRRFVQYGYIGLVAGFYGYYFLYSGDWAYYFSGVWTRETAEFEQLWQPGLYLFDHAIPLPKVVAAPLVLAIGIFAAAVIGTLLERGYWTARQRLNHPISRDVARHHGYSMATFVAINLFYQFGGRPNLNMLPLPIIWAVNVGVLVASTIWLIRSLSTRLPSSRSNKPKALSVSSAQPAALS